MAHADEPGVSVGVHRELGGVSVFFVDEEDRCLDRRFWDLVDGDRKPDGPWWLMSRTWPAYKASEPTLIIVDRYGRKDYVERRQTDAVNGVEVTLDFQARLDDGPRVEARRSEDFTRELLLLPTRTRRGQGEEEAGRALGGPPGMGVSPRSLLGADERRWPSERIRILRRSLVGGVPYADLRWLLSQLGQPSSSSSGLS